MSVYKASRAITPRKTRLHTGATKLNLILEGYRFQFWPVSSKKFESQDSIGRTNFYYTRMILINKIDRILAILELTPKYTSSISIKKKLEIIFKRQ